MCDDKGKEISESQRWPGEVFIALKKRRQMSELKRFKHLSIVFGARSIRLLQKMIYVAVPTCECKPSTYTPRISTIRQELDKVKQ